MKTARTKGVTKRRKTGMLSDVLLGKKKQQLQSADHEKNWAKMLYPIKIYFTDIST